MPSWPPTSPSPATSIPLPPSPLPATLSPFPSNQRGLLQPLLIPFSQLSPPVYTLSVTPRPLTRLGAGAGTLEPGWTVLAIWPSSPLYESREQRRLLAPSSSHPSVNMAHVCKVWWGPAPSLVTLSSERSPWLPWGHPSPGTALGTARLQACAPRNLRRDQAGDDAEPRRSSVREQWWRVGCLPEPRSPSAMEGADPNRGASPHRRASVPENPGPSLQTGRSFHPAA